MFSFVFPFLAAPVAYRNSPSQGSNLTCTCHLHRSCGNTDLKPLHWGGDWTGNATEATIDNSLFFFFFFSFESVSFDMRIPVWGFLFHRTVEDNSWSAWWRLIHFNETSYVWRPCGLNSLGQFKHFLSSLVIAILFGKIKMISCLMSWKTLDSNDPFHGETEDILRN